MLCIRYLGVQDRCISGELTQVSVTNIHIICNKMLSYLIII